MSRSWGGSFSDFNVNVTQSPLQNTNKQNWWGSQYYSLKGAWSMFAVKLHLFKFKCSVLCTLTFSQKKTAPPATSHCPSALPEKPFSYVTIYWLVCTKTHKSMINVMRSGFEGSALILCTPGSYEVMTAIYQTVIYAIIININGGD